jgi:hypothetical protein
MVLAATAACSSGVAGTLGSVLGAGGGARSSELSGIVQSVDTATQELTIQQSNGKTITMSYDSQTRVVYQNQNYPVPALEYGDRVTASVRAIQNGSYYTDYVQVDQSVFASGGATGNVHSLQGKVGYVAASNGWFTVDAGSYGTLTVLVPNNARTNDVVKFQNLQAGDFVRFRGVFLNDARVELRQFN